jgi:hypothetical protein
MLSPSPPPIEPIAPFTGTIKYPHETLRTLASQIVNDLYKHVGELVAAADEAGDDDTLGEENENFIDAGVLQYTVDPLSWKARVERESEDVVWADEDLRHINDKKASEQQLLNMGQTKGKWVGNPNGNGLFKECADGLL